MANDDRHVLFNPTVDGAHHLMVLGSAESRRSHEERRNVSCPVQPELGQLVMLSGRIRPICHRRSLFQHRSHPFRRGML